MGGLGSSRKRKARWLACAVAACGLASGAGAVGACSNSNCGNQPTSFQIFEPNAPTSAIPLCTDSLSGETPPIYYTYPPPRPPLQIDGASGYPFPGSPTLSNNALRQCAVVCAGAAQYAIPCCFSQWVPETVICSPPCTP